MFYTMPRYSKLEEVDNVVYGAGDATSWTARRMIDRLIIAKAAYPLLAELGDRVPLIEEEPGEDLTPETMRNPTGKTPLILSQHDREEKIKMTKSGSKASRITKMIGRIFYNIF